MKKPLSVRRKKPIIKYTVNKEVQVMNINLTAFSEMTDAVNLKLRSEGSVNREVQNTTPVKKETENLVLKEKELQLKREIQESLTMDVNEVKDFLFMLIGAEVKLKPENSLSGSNVNRIA